MHGLRAWPKSPPPRQPSASASGPRSPRNVPTGTTFRTQQQNELKQQRDELEKQKGAVSALQSELEGRRVALDKTNSST